MTKKTQQYMLRIDGKQIESDDQLFELLQSAGVKIDMQFGVVRIDPSGQYVIVRGTTTKDVVENLRKKYGVEAFVDICIRPTHTKTEE